MEALSLNSYESLQTGTQWGAMARNAPSSTLRASEIWLMVLSSSTNSGSSQCLELPVLDPPERGCGY